jgi:anti-sigma factor RsiW
MTARWPSWRRRKGRGRVPGLTCREFVELVTEYLEGALPPAARARFEAHIAVCGNCTAYLAQLRDTIAVVGALQPETLDPGMERELLAAFSDWRDGRG